MKRILTLLMLLSAVFAAGMFQNVGAEAQGSATANANGSVVVGANSSVQLPKPVLVHIENNGDGEMTNSSITINGVNAHVQLQHQIREKNGSIYISNGAIEKEVKWAPNRIKAKLEDHQAGIVKSLNITIADGRPVYLANMVRKVDTGDGELDVNVDVEVDASTGETISENQTINSAGKIRMKSKKIRAMVEPVHARIHLNNALINANGTLDLSITTPRNKTIEVHVVKGEGATVTIDGVAVNTKENLEVDSDNITVGNQTLHIMPAQAKAKLAKNAELKEMALEKVQNKLQYKIKAMEKKRLIGIIPVDVNVDATVDAETGDTQVHGPWWAFLAF